MRLSSIVTESGFNYSQQNTSGVLYPFIHKHVVRQMIPDAYGTVINAAQNVVQQDGIVTKRISFKSIDSVAANANVIILAHISDGVRFGEVLQSREYNLNGSGLAVGTPVSPENISLAAFPNPFGNAVQPAASIQFSIPTTSHVRLSIVDALGREVETLIDSEKDYGTHITRFDASALPAGIYYCTLRAGVVTKTTKLLVTK